VTAAYASPSPRRAKIAGLLALATGCLTLAAPNLARADDAPPAPRPLIAKGQPVDWWFAFKFDGEAFPGCNDEADESCRFGGNLQKYTTPEGEQFVFASSDKPALRLSNACIGQGDDDPLGATFAQVYSGTAYYVIWNDAFSGDPAIPGCSPTCGPGWGHSKGLLAWDDNGEGFVLQVTTPSWPGSGSRDHPRKSNGNTLACVKQNNVHLSQHFFALKVGREDLGRVLDAMINANVATNPKNIQIVKNGGPKAIASLVAKLGTRTGDTEPTSQTLESGIRLISKPPRLHAPPWQVASAELGGVGLRVATWWSAGYVPSTTHSTKVGCWSDAVPEPGAVEIATTGQWEQQTLLDLKSTFNHANVGVATTGEKKLVVFGDLAQDGALSGNCALGQNSAGGLFFVLENETLFDGISRLIQGETASTSPSRKTPAAKKVP
jgi:hypothetical protein